jgi:cyclopropane-fatty-acyl-phospholipid synthase
VFLKNKENLTSLNSTVSWLFSLPQRLTSYRFLNSLGNARSNISAHYDLSDDMFKGMNPLTSFAVFILTLTVVSSSLFI